MLAHSRQKGDRPPTNTSQHTTPPFDLRRSASCERLSTLVNMLVEAQRQATPCGPPSLPVVSKIKVVGGSSNKQLADEIAEEMGLKCGSVTLGRYADGEVMVQLDEHVRGKGEGNRPNHGR